MRISVIKRSRREKDQFSYLYEPVTLKKSLWRMISFIAVVSFFISLSV